MASVIPIRKPLMNPDLDPNLFLRNVLIIKGFILENLVKSSPILKIPKPKTIYITSRTILSTVHFCQRDICFF